MHRWLPIAILGALVCTPFVIARQAGIAKADSAADPPLLIPWSRIGDIGLGDFKTRVESEYGTEGHGFHVLQRYGNSVQGQYRLHHSDVIVTFQGNYVNEIDFVTPYYRTRSGFGIGSSIPLGPCHQVARGPCEHRWNGFVFHPKWKDSVCDCWIKVGLGDYSLSATGARTFGRPWFFIFTKRGRAAEFFFSRSYTD